MSQMAKTLDIDLLNKESQDGRSILKAVDYLVQYVNKPQSAFPYQQIKDWEGVQEKLRWQLYRVDKILGKAVYQKYYKDKLKIVKSGIVVY